MMRLLALLASLIFAFSALTPAAKADQGQAPQPHPDQFAVVKSAAVVSAIGDTLRFCEPGAPGQLKAVHSVPIADWRIDSKIEASVRDALSKRFVVKEIAADREQLSRDMEIKGVENGHLHLKLNEDGVKRTDDVDIIVTIVKYPVSTEVPCQGLGVARQFGAGSDKISIFASYTIVVLTAPTLEIVGVRESAAAAKSPQKRIVDLPGEALWPETPGAPTAEQLVSIRKLIDSMLDDNLADTLSRLGLAPQTPAPGSQ